MCSQHSRLAVPLLLASTLAAPALPGPLPRALQEDTERRTLAPRERITGVLLDAAGKGIAGAQVKILKTKKAKKSDVRGRLSLRGRFAPRPIAVITLPDGTSRVRALPAAVPGAEERAPFTWHLDAPFEARPAAFTDPESDIELARKLLMPIFEAEGDARSENLMFEALDGFVRLDPRLAFSMGDAGDLPGRFLNGMAIAKALTRLAEVAPDEARELFEGLEPTQLTRDALLGYAGALGGEEEKALLVEHIPSLLSVTEESQKLLLAAQLAIHARKVGMKELTASLQARALAMAEEIDGGPSGYVSAYLGLALADGDTDIALDWIRRAEPRLRGRFLGPFAVHVAPLDSKLSIEVAREIAALKPSRDIDDWLPRIAFTLASTDPEHAMALVEELDETGHGCMTLLAGLDEDLRQELAHEWTGKAISRFFDSATLTPLFIRSGTTIGAEILRLAHEFDPEHFDEHLGHAFADYRSRAGDEVNRQMEWVRESALALTLLELDGDLARAFAVPALEAYEAFTKRPERGRLAGEEALYTCILRLDRASALEDMTELDTRIAPLLGSLLTLPPEERSAYSRRLYGRVWAPGD